MAELVLVIASSARMLAQAVVQAGLKPLVIDLYGDRDTQKLAVAYLQVPSFSWAGLGWAVEDFVGRFRISHAVYGSGFECYPDSLYRLGQCVPLSGNPPDVFALVNDKPVFFSKLSRLGIPFPETLFSRPKPEDGWLIKPKLGQGGLGIMPEPAGFSGQGCYWQRFQPGVPHSVTFLADGRQVRVIGFNRQWTTRFDGGQAFIFSGMINQAAIPRALRSELTAWLAKIVPEFSLRGVNSMDFIWSGEQAFVLEINPRIPASLQLYEVGLFQQHITSSQQPLSAGNPSVGQGGYSAYQIVHATGTVRIPDHFVWPSGCVDLPAAGAICRKDQPICSIIAHHSSSEGVLQLLQNTRHRLLISLTGNISHGI